MNRYVLAIDAGTTNVLAMVLDDSGQVKGKASFLEVTSGLHSSSEREPLFLIPFSGLKSHQGPEILEDAHIHHMDFHTGGQKLGHVIE